MRIGAYGRKVQYYSLSRTDKRFCRSADSMKYKSNKPSSGGEYGGSEPESGGLSGR